MGIGSGLGHAVPSGRLILGWAGAGGERGDEWQTASVDERLVAVAVAVAAAVVVVVAVTQ